MRNSFLKSLSLLAGLSQGVLSDTVTFSVKLTWEKGAPDGFERDMIRMNGQFPGPPLIVDEGDDVEFIVENRLPNVTSIHFHGIEQLNTPWSDGVPGLSQTPIEPGCNFTYKWTATQYGTYWYHGHYRGQLEDGLFGAIHINPKSGTPNPFRMISNFSNTLRQLNKQVNNPQLVLLSDWSHFTSEVLHDVSVAANIDPLCGDSILVNGQGNVNCPGVPFLMSLVPPPALPILQGQNLTDKGCIALTNTLAQTTQAHNLSAIPPDMFSGCVATNTSGATIKVQPHAGWASLNFISTASLQELVVSIDDHTMWVYAVDGRYIEPEQVDAIAFSHGSRYSVMVELNQPSSNYVMRLAGDGLNQKVFQTATFHYIGGGKKFATPNPSINYAGANTTADVTFLDAASVLPFPAIKPSPTADQTYILTMGRNVGGAWQWSLNDKTAFNESLEDIPTPLLWNPDAVSYPLTITTKNNTWVDLILVVPIAYGLQPPHPIHKHSNKAFIIGSSTGKWNWTSTAEAMKVIPESFNLETPTYRDGFYTLPASTEDTWMVVRYFVENPGAFLLHCHINPHLTGGMAVDILDGIDVWPTVPAEYGPGGNGS